MPSSLKDRNSLRSNSLSFLTGVSLSLFYASKMRTGVEVGFPPVVEWFMMCTFCLCTFSFACPKEKDTKKERAPSAFLRLRRMPSSLKDRNSLRSNSLSFLTGVSLSLFYASKMRTGVEVGFPLRHANRTIPYYNIYLIYIWRTEHAGLRRSCGKPINLNNKNKKVLARMKLLRYICKNEGI